MVAQKHVVLLKSSISTAIVGFCLPSQPTIVAHCRNSTRRSNVPCNRKNKDGQPGRRCAIQLAFWITHVQCVVPSKRASNGQVSAAAAHDPTGRRRLQTVLACSTATLGAGQWSISARSSLELRHDALIIRVGSVAGSYNSPSMRQRVHVRRDRIPIIVHVDFQ